jgi:four helix bundle protein
MQDFKKLLIWQRAHQLALKIYKITKPFPQEEKYGLVSQIRSSSTSICANIAEGCGRAGGADFTRFLFIAMGSASETECHLLLARDLGLINSHDFGNLETEIYRLKRMLNVFIKRIKPIYKSHKNQINN